MQTHPTHYPAGDVARAVIAGVADTLRDEGVGFVDVRTTGKVTSLWPIVAGAPSTFLAVVSGHDEAIIWRTEGGNRETRVPLAKAGQALLDIIRKDIATTSKAVA